MKIIDTDKAVDPNKQQPFSTRSLYFLQRAFQENYRYLANAIVGASYDYNTPYVIDGCVLSNANKDISDGHIFYKNGIYTVHSLSNSTGTPIKFIEVLTPDATADPTTFSDGSIENVHIDHDFNAVDSATVTYDFSATDLVYLRNKWTAYTPTLTCTDNVGANVVGGFTASGIFAYYLFTGETLSLFFSFSGITTLSNSYNLEISIPTLATLGTPWQMQGEATCWYSAASASFIRASIGLTDTGAGYGLELTKIDGTSFGASTGGSSRFQIDIVVLS